MYGGANMPKSVEKYVCCSCGEPKSFTQFYKTSSGFYSAGILPICKKCFSSKFGIYAAEYHSNKKAMQRMCMAFDVYFDEDLFDQCDVKDDAVIGKYFRQLNMQQNKGKTFDTSIDNGTFSLSGERKGAMSSDKRVVVVDEYGNEQDDEDKVKPEDVARWGDGLMPIDYENLNNHYKFLKSANTHCDSNQEIFISDLCYAKMQQLKCVRAGDMDNFKKMGEYYNSTFIKSGLKVASEAEANSDDVLGVWNVRISQYTPEEYYKNKKLYSDHDSLKDYVERFLLRPLRNLQYGTTERDKEFYVKDGDDDEYIDADTD